ncbi:MAG: hypothetical protein ABI824_08985 [Acidobacteriota bacterium]
MSCEDLDRLRSSSSDHSSTWSAEAKAHLSTCPRCAQLQESLDSAPDDLLPDALQRSIEAQILPGLTAVTPLPGVAWIATNLILSSIFIATLANWHLGVAGWRARSDLQLFVDLALLAVAIGTLAKTLAVRMMPGSSDTKPLAGYVAAPLIALAVADLLLFGYRWNPNFFPIALWCWEIGITCAAISAPLFWMILRRGLWLNRVAQCAATGLLAGLVGVAVLEIYCPYLDRLHIGAGHIGAALTASLVGAAVGAVLDRIERR